MKNLGLKTKIKVEHWYWNLIVNVWKDCFHLLLKTSISKKTSQLFPKLPKINFVDIIL
jgi:hypothetical protein